jgi:hypothetical protein
MLVNISETVDAHIPRALTSNGLNDTVNPYSFNSSCSTFFLQKPLPSYVPSGQVNSAKITERSVIFQNITSGRREVSTISIGKLR